MKSTRFLIFGILSSIILVVFGVIGYQVIEGWPLIDALYMTIITITTVGYKEVHQLSSAGQAFTIFLIIIGVSFFLYMASSIVQSMIEGSIRELLGRKKLDRKINRLKNHYIICGYGRIGRVLCNKLREKPIDLVVIDTDADLVPVMDKDGILYVPGNASDEATLMQAGIKNAKGLVAALATDTDNVFLILTAKQLNPDLFIVARATHEASKSKLIASGANLVESPYDMGAARMAQRILNPTVTDFLDLAFTQNRKDIQMEEIPIKPESKLANVALMDSGIRQKFNLIIIAIQQASGEMLFNPSFETKILPGETVIAVGEEKNLERLAAILNPI